MRLRLRDREPDRNDTEKRWIGSRRALLGKITADVEAQLILRHRDRLVMDERAIGAAVGVGRRARNQPRAARTDLEELDGYSRRGTAAMGVENMRREPAMHLEAVRRRDALIEP